jgi:predicted nucleic acid-binding protein
LRDELLLEAESIGAASFLRGADALYAATSRTTDGQLVSWDREMVERAGAITPSDWLK